MGRVKPRLNLAEQIRISWAHFTKKGRTWGWCWYSLSNDHPSEAFNKGLHYVHTPQKSHKDKLWVTYKPIKKSCLILSSFGFKSRMAWLDIHQVLIGGHKHWLRWYSDMVRFANIDGVTWLCQPSAVCTCMRFQSLLPLYFLWCDLGLIDPNGVYKTLMWHVSMEFYLSCMAVDTWYFMLAQDNQVVLLSSWQPG